MFVPVKSDTGAVHPWHFVEATPGKEYHAGQLLTVTDGKVDIAADAAAKPTYLSMTERAIPGEAEGNAALIPVIRIHEDTVFETTLSAEAQDAKPGVLAALANDGTETTGAASGPFELTEVFGTAQGDTVRGRFVTPAASEAV